MHTVLIPRQNLDFMLSWLEPKLNGDELATTSAVLDVAEELAADAFLNHYKQADQSEPRLEPDGVHVLPAIGAALRQYAELGFFAAGFARPLGGMGLSTLVSSAIFAQFAAANIATSAYPMLTAANARLIARFGSAEQIQQFALPQRLNRQQRSYHSAAPVSRRKTSSSVGFFTLKSVPPLLRVEQCSTTPLAYLKVTS
jgi:alkylation response protein AidB-like acyl-CoA dehydrogenase